VECGLPQSPGSGCIQRHRDKRKFRSTGTGRRHAVRSYNGPHRPGIDANLGLALLGSRAADVSRAANDSIGSKLRPSEYWRPQCKATFQFDPISAKLIDDIGVETVASVGASFDP
jgi:hypothetical protein